MFAFIAGLIGLLILVFLWGFGILATIFWLWMLIHAITNKGLDSVEKLIWVLVIFFLHFLGALIYFFVGRPKAAPFS
jgi:Phospholipase_D-nuclease N-terminal